MVALDWFLWFVFLVIGAAAILLEFAIMYAPDFERGYRIQIPDVIKENAGLIGAISLSISMYCVMNAMSVGVVNRTETLTLRNNLDTGNYQLIGVSDGGQNRCLFWLSPVDEPAQVLPYIVSSALVSLRMYQPEAEKPIPSGFVRIDKNKMDVWIRDQEEAKKFPSSVNNLLNVVEKKDDATKTKPKKVMPPPSKNKEKPPATAPAPSVKPEATPENVKDTTAVPKEKPVEKPKTK